MRGQSAFETLVTVGVMLAFTLPIVLLMLSASNLRLEDTSLLHGQATVQQISDTINEVYLQGPGAKRTMLIEMPATSKSLNISNRQVVMSLTSNGGEHEISHSLLTDAGPYYISTTGLTKIEITVNATGGVTVK
jgi:hypothetical protein